MLHRCCTGLLLTQQHGVGELGDRFSFFLGTGKGSPAELIEISGTQLGRGAAAGTGSGCGLREIKGGVDHDQGFVAAAARRGGEIEQFPAGGEQAQIEAVAEQGVGARRGKGSKGEAVELGIGRDPEGVETLQSWCEGVSS